MASDLCTAMEDEISSKKIDLDGEKLVESKEAVEDSATSTKRKPSLNRDRQLDLS